MFNVEPILLRSNATAMEAEALRDAEEHEVSRVLRQHDVARIAEAFGDQIQQLLRAVRDEYLIGIVWPLVELREALRSQTAQLQIACGRTVLERRTTRLSRREQLVGKLPRRGDGKRFIVRETG